MKQSASEQMEHLLNWMLKNKIQYQNPDFFRIGYDGIIGHLHAKPKEVLRLYAEANIKSLDASMTEILCRWSVGSFNFDNYDAIFDISVNKIEGYSLDDAMAVRRMLDERYRFLKLIE